MNRSEQGFDDAQRFQAGISLATSRADNSGVQSCNPSILYPMCSTPSSSGPRYFLPSSYCNTDGLLNSAGVLSLIQSSVTSYDDLSLRTFRLENLLIERRMIKIKMPQHTIVPIEIPAMVAVEKREERFASSRGRGGMATTFCTKLPFQLHRESEKVLRS